MIIFSRFRKRSIARQTSCSMSGLACWCYMDSPPLSSVHFAANGSSNTFDADTAYRLASDSQCPEHCSRVQSVDQVASPSNICFGLVDFLHLCLICPGCFIAVLKLEELEMLSCVLILTCTCTVHECFQLQSPKVVHVILQPLLRMKN